MRLRRDSLGLNSPPMGEALQVRLRARDKTELTVRVTPLPERRYRFEETPFLAIAPEPLHVGDIVEAELQGDGTHAITRIVERAPFRHYSWVIARQFFESEGYRAFVAGVTAAGGCWERLFGGGCSWFTFPREVHSMQGRSWTSGRPTIGRLEA